MGSILEVTNLCKTYPDFKLDNVSFQLPHGAILGFIGENGAGKSTTLNSILGLTDISSGEIKIFGTEHKYLDKSQKEKIGVVFDGNNYHEILTPFEFNKILSMIYPSWDANAYFGYLNRFSLSKNKKIKQFSKGMKMKFSIAVALSHNSQLLILDEPTSGLDPIMRDEILDIFLDFVQDENHSILVSSHIISDLEKVADYITFIHGGKLLFSLKKDELIYDYGIIKCGAALFDEIDKTEVLAYRKLDYEWQVLVPNVTMAREKYKTGVIDNANIEEIMLLYAKGEDVR